MRRYIGIILLLLFIILGGCSKSNIPTASKEPPLQKIKFTNSATDIIGLTVSSDAELYVHDRNSFIKRYKSDGTLIQEYPNTTDLTAMCWYDNTLYAYDAVKYQIVGMNIEDGTTMPIIEDFKVDGVLNLVVAEGYLYALVVPSYANTPTIVNGFTDLGVKLYQIDISTGKIKDTKEERVIAIYGASDETLYYYAYRDDTYALFSYNSKKEKSKKLFDMSATGSINAFVYEDDYMICNPAMNPCLKVLKLSEKFEKQLDKDMTMPSGNFMTYLKGNLIYFGFMPDNKGNSIKAIFLDDIMMSDENASDDGTGKMNDASAGNDDTSNAGSLDDEESLDDAGSSVNASSSDNAGSSDEVVISTALGYFINTDTIAKNTGLKARIVEPSVYDDVLLTDIMAGNSDVDIYITASDSIVASGMKDKNIYVPLNDSKAIQAYKDKCFDYVADSMQASSGDVWMLPISINAQVIWYVPDNTDKFNINLEDFKYLDSFLELCGRMPKTGSYAAYVDSALSYWQICHFQYDFTYNDYTYKKVNFDTELYKHIFDKLWTGVETYQGRALHPIFRDSRDDYNGELPWEAAPFDKTKLIYKWSDISNQLNMPQTILDNWKPMQGETTMPEYTLEGWRALPMPRISSDVKGNFVSMNCAFINPYSKNKERAFKYLEAITEAPFDFTTRYTSAMFFKDKNMYKDKYDITQPAFGDIYNIMSNGMFKNSTFFPSDSIINDYQSGKLTLDEAVAAIQREAEMWLNE